MADTSDMCIWVMRTMSRSTEHRTWAEIAKKSASSQRSFHGVGAKIITMCSGTVNRFVQFTQKISKVHKCSHQYIHTICTVFELSGPLAHGKLVSYNRFGRLLFSHKRTGFLLLGWQRPGFSHNPAVSIRNDISN